MKTYNDIIVPNLIRVDRIISAFSNCIDNSKVEQYTEVMEEEMLYHDFPPIMGFPSIITKDDVREQKVFLTGEEVTKENIGQLVWVVTDGHHRSLAAIKANLPHLEVELDYSCITSEADLAQYKNL